MEPSWVRLMPTTMGASVISVPPVGRSDASLGRVTLDGPVHTFRWSFARKRLTVVEPGRAPHGSKTAHRPRPPRAEHRRPPRRRPGAAWVASPLSRTPPRAGRLPGAGTVGGAHGRRRRPPPAPRPAATGDPF